MCLVDPSSLTSMVIGRMPRSEYVVHTGKSVSVETTVMLRPPTMPAMAYLPSGVT